MKKSEKNYSIGLDIGTNSVGWAVVDENGELFKFKKNHMWGSRLFSEAQTAAERRAYRSNRRRMERRKERIRLLQEILSPEIEKVDPTFYLKMKESKLWPEDKKHSEKYNLFTEENFTEKEYFDKFPTVYHLRRKLSRQTEKADIRLVYLAIHHILKYRGHFLYENENINASGDIEEVAKSLKNIFDFILELSEIYMNCEEIEKNIKIIIETLQEKISKKKKIEKIILQININDKELKGCLKEILNLIMGYKGNLAKIFSLPEEKKISFSNDIDSEIYELIGDDIEIFEEINNIYNWSTLQDIMSMEFLPKEYKDDKNKTISYSFISKYEKYANDLKLLKKLYKEKAPSKYNEMFRNDRPKTSSYYNYDNNISECKDKNSTGYEALCSKIKADFPDVFNNKVDSNLEMNTEIKYFKEEIENESFLRKLNTRDNGSIPHQLHAQELKMIIEKQSIYYPCLTEKDILKIMNFRIPYYVGPLRDDFNGKSFAWSVRNENMDHVKVTPWNFDEVINKEESAEKFICRMTNKCTYFIEEDVLPKNSLIYSEFCLLNELNNIKIIQNKDSENGSKTVERNLFDKEQKEKIINELFMAKTTVKEKDLRKWIDINLQNKGEYRLSGYGKDKEFASNLKPQIDFVKKVFKCNSVDELDKNMVEEIIKWITLFEDKSILASKLKKYNDKITEIQKKEILKLKYTGWGQLSKRLLVDEKTNYKGLKLSVMDIMRNTNKNLMKIITDKDFEFKKKIEEAIPKIENKNIGENFYKENIEVLACSPKVKKGIWQAILVVDELVNIMKHNPTDIFIELARSDEEGKRTVSKYDKIKQSLQLLGDTKEIIKQLEKDKKNKIMLDEKRLLYYIQNGKCMYSGEALDIENLHLYEIDHILPQCYIKDDSIENKALVKRRENQRKIDSLLLDQNIILTQTKRWSNLLKCNLIGNKKFANLTRTEITDSNLISFINRQLVETRQITKHVANILGNLYENSSINSVKACLSSDFKSKFGIIKNRKINDYHHAHDAYIACIVGSFIKKRYPQWGEKLLDLNKYKMEFNKNKEIYRRNTHKNQYGFIIEEMNKDIIHIDGETGEIIWDKKDDLPRIKKTLSLFDCYVTKKVEEVTSEFYNQNAIKKVSKGKGKKSIPLKSKEYLEPEKYGAYSGEQKAFSVIFSYINKKGIKEFKLEGIPVYVAKSIKDKTDLKKYFESIGYNDVNIIKKKIFKNQLFQLNGMTYLLVSDTEFVTFKQLVLPEKYKLLINNLEKVSFIDKINEENLLYEYYKVLKKDNTSIEINKEKLLEDFRLKCEEDKRNLLKISYGIDEKDINDLYNILVDKLEKTYKCSKSIIDTLKNGENIFNKLETTAKSDFINILLTLCKGKRADFKSIGGPSEVGRLAGKNIETKMLKEIMFIDQSVTGLFEKRYNIYELENSYSKQSM